MTSRILFSFFASMVILTTLLPACSKKDYSNRPAYQFKSITGIPDYSDLNYWAAHPGKKDPSDSVPAPLTNIVAGESAVDVFFVYPTTFTEGKDVRWNAAIDDQALNAKTDYSTILFQASIFNEQARIFAPRYRQAHFRAFTSSSKDIAAAALALAYEDVKRAFEYYLAHYNNGRPIIIAAHSQGTIHAAHLLKDFFDGKILEHKLVCAYLIGMPVGNKYFSKIPSCKDSLATGCFVSWRSYKTGFEGEPYIGNEKDSAVVVNPLTWTSARTYASASKNSGSILFKFNKISKGVSAQVHKNILWTGRPRFFGNILLVRKNYHIADLNLFYMNVRENVKTRIEMFGK